ncbi:hypothetical protein [Sphingomonas sp. LM7]|uniref:hypothetical protein n=1 Tax=Sphingomonas sp. LM7 TaxID=1938607 RepID=UPI000983A6B7|nr:hypothetical protein [Sphingomonas sp. LM7]AQR74302.1 hypothetical protein BXU08_12145 [Sphingomonas sp. LM7]
MNRAETAWWETRTFVVAAILLSMVPLLVPAIPPLTDLPGHMGRYRVMLGTDAATLSQWYEFHWGIAGNLGVDLLVAGLAPLLGLEIAVKLVILAIAGLTASGIMWISREAHGRIQPWVLFALPLVFNYSFLFGFVNHALSMALALNAFAFWLRLGRQNRIWLRAALFVPLSALIWLAHVVGWGVLGILAFGAELARARRQGRSWPATPVAAGVACLPLALPMVLLLVWRSGEGAGATGRFFEVRLKLGFLAMALRDRWAPFDIASVALIAIILYRAVRDRRVEHAPPIAAAALLLLAAFALLPFILFGSAFADMRIAPFMLILALLTFRTGEAFPARERATLALIGLAFFAARTAGTTIGFWMVDREWNRHLQALDHIPRGARLVTFVGSRCIDTWAHPRESHLSALALVRRSAFSNDQWLLAGSTPITVIAPGLGKYATDPSQLVLLEPCPIPSDFMTMNDALAGLPRDRFDYVWLINPPAHDPRLTAGMQALWRNETDILYRIDNRRLSEARATH